MADAVGRIPAKYRQIAEHFRDEISSGRLQPGDQLPSQKEIIGEFGVVMATVVRALDELRREGLVETRPGLGTFVVKQEPSAEFVTVMARLDGLAEEVRQLRETVAELKAERRKAL